MSPETQVMLSGSLTFGVPLVLALRELVVLRRRGNGGWRRERTPEPTTPKPLPPCLLIPPRLVRPPEPMPEKRVLEIV